MSQVQPESGEPVRKRATTRSTPNRSHSKYGFLLLCFFLVSCISPIEQVIAAAPASQQTAVPVPTAIGGTILGTTNAAHSTTRGHNRKVIYDAVNCYWYVFWLYYDKDTPFTRSEGMVYKSSPDGMNWSDSSRVVENHEGGGSSAFDIISDGTDLYALTNTGADASGKIRKYGVRRLVPDSTGSLDVHPEKVVYDNANGDWKTVHFYGSLLLDRSGYFWVAARVGDADPNTRAEVIRSTTPNDISRWGPNGCLGVTCNDQWIDPYNGRQMLQGTIANRILDLGNHGVGIVTYNKINRGPQSSYARLLFVKNTTGAEHDWQSPGIELTSHVNQCTRPGRGPGCDTSRGDDRRFSAVIDPVTNVIHVAYITRDTSGSENANLKYFTLSPPNYTLADKSSERRLVAGETDGVQLAMDTRTTPTTLYLFYVENRHPDYQVKMLRMLDGSWESESRALPISTDSGTVRHVQVPENITTNEFPVVYQHSVPEGSGYYYEIKTSLIRLNGNL